jgi:hypothetical protein
MRLVTITGMLVAMAVVTGDIHVRGGRAMVLLVVV